MYALDPGAGTPKAGWPFTTGSFVYSSPAVAADGAIIVASYDGRVYALNPDGTQKGSPWPFIPGTSLFSSPAIGTNGTIYVG